METTTKKILTHVWQDAGLGRAPFRIAAWISRPGPGLQEANPDAYINAMRDCQAQAQHFGVGLGSCDYCGMDLMNNVVIRDADGKHFVVGCDCAMKTGDSKLMTEAEALKREHDRKLRRQRQEAEREAHFQALRAEGEAQRERNGGLTDYEVEQNRILREREEFLAGIQTGQKWLVDLLLAHSKTGDDFCASIAHKLRSQKFLDMSEKVQDIVVSIYVKDAIVGLKGRAREKAETIARHEFWGKAGRVSPELAALNIRQAELDYSDLKHRSEEWDAQWRVIRAEIAALEERGLGLISWAKAHGR